MLLCYGGTDASQHLRMRNTENALVIKVNIRSGIKLATYKRKFSKMYRLFQKTLKKYYAIKLP